MKHKKIIIPALAVASSLAIGALSACSSEDITAPTEFEEAGNLNENNAGEEQNTPTVTVPEETVTPAPKPKVEKASYILIGTEGLNIRSGAGPTYSSMGAAEKGTLMALCGKTGGWYKTYYKNKTAYVSANYCTVVYMDKHDADVESVIEEGCKCLGTKYVYGAVRYHDGKGNRLSGFTKSEFDCSSLMQYIFKLGVDKNLQVNTRTQIYQGSTVKKSDLKRGDLIFFTNASRRYNVGVERVGHVALYLGDNYILHTASDFAKIEQISPTRWSYYIQTQRMI